MWYFIHWDHLLRRHIFLYLFWIEEKSRIKKLSRLITIDFSNWIVERVRVPHRIDSCALISPSLFLLPQTQLIFFYCNISAINQINFFYSQPPRCGLTYYRRRCRRHGGWGIVWHRKSKGWCMRKSLIYHENSLLCYAICFPIIALLRF